MCSCITVIRESKIKHAKKEYNCMAAEWIYNCWSKNGNPFTFTEWRTIVKAKNNNWKIKMGDSYIKQINQGDDFYVFRAIPELHAICLKYDIYPCDC